MRNAISSGITACRLKYSGHSSVLVVEPAQYRHLDDSFSKLIWYNGGDCPFRNLLVYSLVWSRPIEIRNGSKQDTVQLLLTEDQDVIQALSSDTPQKAFTDGSGSGRMIGCFENLDAAHGSPHERNRVQTCSHDRA